MANKNVTLTDDNGNNLYPITLYSNITGLSGQISNLANKDLSNVTYPTYAQDGLSHIGNGDRVVEMKASSDGRTWYRRWASGWKEMGAIISYSSGQGTYTLPLSFSNTQYIAVGNVISTANTIFGLSIQQNSKSTIGFTKWYQAGHAGEDFMIYCCGY